MAATLGSVVEGILDTLYGHSAQQDAFTSLTAAIDASTTSLTVDDASILDSGLIEIDTELMRVKNYDTNTGEVTITPTGRGVRGTTAAAHALGAEVRVAPIMPYASVVREVNAEINSLYPRLSAVATTEFAYNATTETYALPADVGVVLDVRYKTPIGVWDRVRAWEIEFGQNTTDYASGVTLRALSPIVSTIRVIYGKRPTNLTTLTDTLASTGLPESVEDVLRLGAIIRLLPSMDIARLSAISVPTADANDKPPSPGTGVMVARELKQQYKDRLEQEVITFRTQYPARVHITR